MSSHLTLKQARNRAMLKTTPNKNSFGPLFDLPIVARTTPDHYSDRSSKDTSHFQTHLLPGDGPMVLSVAFSDGLPTLHDWLEWLRGQLASKPRLVFGWASDCLMGDLSNREHFLQILKATLRWGFSVCLKTMQRLDSDEAKQLQPMTSQLRFLVPLLGYSPAIDEWIRVSDRLEVLRSLRVQGFSAKAAWEPMIPGVHDRSEVFDRVLRELTGLNLKTVQVAFGHLPEDRMGRLLPGPVQQAKRMGVSEVFQNGPGFRIAGQKQRLLPLESRQKAFTRLHTLGAKWGIRVDVCPWNNPDFLASPIVVNKVATKSLLQKFLDMASHPG